MNSQKPIRGVQINKTHPLSKGLVGCWLFNEMTGETVFDLSGNDNHGTLENGVAWGSNGLEFDGVDDYVDAGYNTSIDFEGESQSFTIESCININSLSTDGTIVGRWGPDVGFQYILKFGSGTNDIKFAVQDFETNIAQSAASAVALGEWISVVGVADSGIIKVYINGVLSGTTDTYGTVRDTGSSSLEIGMRNGGTSQPFNGTIRSVNICNRALSAEEIAWSYREPYAMFDKPLSPALLYAAAAAGAENPYWYYEMLRRRNR